MEENVEKVAWVRWIWFDQEVAFQRHRWENQSFFVAKLCLLLVTFLIFLSYWVSILMQNPRIETYFWCLASALCFIVTHVGEVIWSLTNNHRNVNDQMAIHKKISIGMIFSLIFAFVVIVVYQIRLKPCIPILVLTHRANECDENYGPEDLLMYMIFLPVMYLLVYPNVCWFTTCFFYCTSLAVNIASAVFFPIHHMPSLVLSIFFSLCTAVMIRVESVKAFSLYCDVEKQSRLRSEAEVGVRLRRMIGGISHDLKSVSCVYLFDVYQSIT